MERIEIEPRSDWKAKVEELGFGFHTAESLYWNEAAYYRFSRREIDELEAATQELHRICLEAVQHVIDRKIFGRLGMPEAFAPLIVNSWEREDLSLYGRFDLFYDGKHQPKMYEYNADTPTALFEASAVQWYWLEERFAQDDQFNSIHEKLIERWRESEVNGPVHFACVRDHAEDFTTTLYIEDTAIQAGLKTTRLYVDEIGWNGTQFVDLENRPITTLFKLYPWEWMIREEFAPYLLKEPWRLVEPAWKMILSNKGILPLLWELFPDHPNLLPAFDSAEPLGETYVKKPRLGREGANITVCVNGCEVATEGEYGQEGFVYQAFLPPPEFDGRHPVIGSWIVRDEPAGIGIREGALPITDNMSSFVPHLIREG